MLKPAAAAAPTMAIDERRAPRFRLRLNAALRCTKAPTQPVEVTDLSRFGCRLSLERRISIGTFVTLSIPDFVEVTGWVAWGSDEALGIDFSHPLPGAVLDHIVSLGPPPPAA